MLAERIAAPVETPVARHVPPSANSGDLRMPRGRAGHADVSKSAADVSGGCDRNRRHRRAHHPTGRLAGRWWQGLRHVHMRKHS